MQLSISRILFQCQNTVLWLPDDGAAASHACPSTEAAQRSADTIYFAILARTKESLVFIRSLCETAGIHICWGMDSTTPLHRIREIAQFIDPLREQTKEIKNFFIATDNGPTLERKFP